MANRRRDIAVIVIILAALGGTALLLGIRSRPSSRAPQRCDPRLPRPRPERLPLDVPHDCKPR